MLSLSIGEKGAGGEKQVKMIEKKRGLLRGWVARRIEGGLL